jgi:hypothetical protein
MIILSVKEEPEMKIAITGADGSGKTSVIRHLRGTGHCAFRAPQYHEDPDAPFHGLSSTIDALSVLADRRGDAALKSTALFLSMTLYGDVLAHYERTFRPERLFAERQAVVDSLAYSRFYRALLTGPLDPGALEPLIAQELGADALDRLHRWASVLDGRVAGVERVDLWGIPAFLLRTFELPTDALVARLARLYHAEPPDVLVVLRVDGEELERRLRLKAAEGTQRELHERRGVVEQLQQALIAAAGAMGSMYPGLRVEIVDSAPTVEHTAERVLAVV